MAIFVFLLFHNILLLTPHLHFLLGSLRSDFCIIRGLHIDLWKGMFMHSRTQGTGAPETPGVGAEDPVWEESVTASLTAPLVHLPMPRKTIDFTKLSFGLLSD